MKDLLSPKQVARAIGVSESSLKRWCDQGLIQSIRTAGGHRKLPIVDVIRFLRERQRKVICPEVLGMPVRSQQSEIGLERGRIAFTEALLAGNESAAQQIVLDLYLAKHPICTICDIVISGAFQEIGSRWACQSVDVYQERRACEMTHRVLYELRRTQPEPESSLRACGGTLEGDPYSLSTTMAELVLRDVGWNATSLGASIPMISMVQALHEIKPRLFWLSVSHVENSDQFARDIKDLSSAANAVGAAFAVGGRAATHELLGGIPYSHCETMRQLAAFGQCVRENEP